ncbi:4Fe-4S dicluster domain-containing protein [uncultured Slackia sp.]|uniref:4Fe-4S dicluster domain-containing protein n=1 Tax=uncultured Slackia sp. TaxID=665903 RepID=UPI00345C0872
MRYGMVIDTELCAGCNACAVACKINNNLPKEVWWNSVVTEGGATRDTASGEWPNNSMRFFPKACQHCRKPLCVAQCSTGATYVADDGTVQIDAEKCDGCGACIEACPYDVRVLVQNDPEYYQEVALGQWDAPKHSAGKVGKCTLCANIRERGGDPACVKACNLHARVFGDLDDPESEVSRILASGEREYMRLLEEESTEPNVYYLM